ncbi:hypothetical protein F2P56_007270 [Juglans regia]|uniref:Uncharacterized protein n=1 Tax=Juglans regia TaxID=51240 RepID=A0A833Y302_JUGRE|nr:hypothetical protein F2P56_007270 [Juglans regia]
MHFLFLFHITAAKASLYVLKFYCVFCSDSFNNILQMLPSKDANFVGYTYKNFEIVNEDHIPGIAELKKKNNKPKRPSIRSLFDTPDPPDRPALGNFLNILPTQSEVPESSESEPLRQSARSAQHQDQWPMRR